MNKRQEAEQDAIIARILMKCNQAEHAIRLGRAGGGRAPAAPGDLNRAAFQNRPAATAYGVGGFDAAQDDDQYDSSQGYNPMDDLEEDDSGDQEYDAYDEEEEYADDDGFSPSSDRHKRMTTDSHMHGRYAAHLHTADACHRDVPLASAGSVDDSGDEGEQYDESDALQDAAEVIALDELGKPLAALEHTAQMKLYERAARQIGYGHTKARRQPR